MHLPLISQKASRFTESVIRGMTVEARKFGAINLAQGMPDFPPLLRSSRPRAARSKTTLTSMRLPGARKTSARRSPNMPSGIWASRSIPRPKSP